MTASNSTLTGPDTQTHRVDDACRVLRAAKASLEQLRLSKASGHLPTQEELLPALTEVCRELADHLTGYAICASNYDEDAFIAVERAERLLFDYALSTSLPRA